MQWTSETPAKSGIYGFRILDHAPVVVDLDVADDKIWEPSCLRALSTYRDPQYQALWCGPLKIKSETLPPLPV